MRRGKKNPRTKKKPFLPSRSPRKYDAIIIAHQVCLRGTISLVETVYHLKVLTFFRSSMIKSIYFTTKLIWDIVGKSAACKALRQLANATTLTNSPMMAYDNGRIPWNPPTSRHDGGESATVAELERMASERWCKELSSELS